MSVLNNINTTTLVNVCTTIVYLHGLSNRSFKLCSYSHMTYYSLPQSHFFTDIQNIPVCKKQWKHKEGPSTQAKYSLYQVTGC